jgi:hypothetical protein
MAMICSPVASHPRIVLFARKPHTTVTCGRAMIKELRRTDRDAHESTEICRSAGTATAAGAFTGPSD